MSIEQVLAAQAEADVRQAEALEGIYACLQVIAKKLTAPTVVSNTISAPAEEPESEAEIAQREGDQEEAEEAEEPKKPAGRGGSRRQAKNQERPEPEPEEEEEAPEVDPLEDDQAPEKEYSSDDVKDALRSYREINGNAAMMKLFAKYGAQGMGTLKPEDYAAIIADAS